MENKDLKSLINKYINDAMTPAEEAELMEYIERQKNTTDIRNLMLQDWDNFGGNLNVAMDDAKADLIFNSIITTGNDGRKTSYSTWMSWAAVFVFFCFAAIFYYTKFSEGDPSTESLSVVKLSATNEHRKVNLPDGSFVILNNNSSLEYKKNFFGSTREVVLKGEGYFDIKHENNRPFIVHSGNLKTTVLGTAFNIKAMDGADSVVVTVTRGKVSVENGHKVLGILVPDQQIVFNRQIKHASLAKVEATKVVAWQEKDLFFEDTSMEEAAKILEKKYDIKINFESELGKNCRFSATFLEEQSLEEIIRVIAAFNGATYTIHSGEIKITGNNCNN